MESNLAGWWRVVRGASFDAGGTEEWILVVSLSDRYSEPGRSLLPGRQANFRPLTGMVYALSGMPSRDALGTAVDRARRILSEDFGIDPHDVHAEAFDKRRAVASGSFRFYGERMHV